MYTLLIADDEQLERQAVRFIVEQNCPEIRIIGETGDGLSAVRIAADEKPDIIMMDIRMPVMNGLEASLSIRAFMPDTAIIMLTAFDEFSYAKQALLLGAMEYLLKPARPDDIVRTLQATILRVGEIKTKQQEEALLRKSVEEALPFIQMSFIYDLISGNISEMAQFQERSRFLGMRLNLGVAMIVDIDNFNQLTCGFTEIEKQMMKQKIYKIICSVAGNHALVTPFGGDDLIVLLGFAEGETAGFIRKDTRETAESIQAAIKREMSVGVTIGIGRYYSDPRDIHKSYLEAINAQRQRFYLGNSQIIHIEDVPHLDTGPFNYPFHYERTVMDKVRCGDRNQAKAALRELLDGIFATKAGMDTVKACALELLIVLSRAAVEGGGNLEQLTLLNFNCIDQLTSCHDNTQVEEWMFDSLNHFMDNMLENRDGMNLRVINKACDYIVKNCHKNISLEEVAQTAHLSPFYFSRLFKQEKGCNFVDFTTRIRIDKAKIMLKNPELTAVRISTEVGYQDASYFSRVFRQMVGLTPNQYRSEMRKKSRSEIPTAIE